MSSTISDQVISFNLKDSGFQSHPLGSSPSQRCVWVWVPAKEKCGFILSGKKQKNGGRRIERADKPEKSSATLMTSCAPTCTVSSCLKSKKTPLAWHWMVPKGSLQASPTLPSPPHPPETGTFAQMALSQPRTQSACPSLCLCSPVPHLRSPHLQYKQVPLNCNLQEQLVCPHLDVSVSTEGILSLASRSNWKTGESFTIVIQ